MDTFLKTIAGILVAVLLNLCLSKQAKDYSLLLTVLVCCCIAGAAVYYLEQVVSFIQRLNQTAQLDSNALLIILKVVGIGILGEIVTQICADSGNASLGRMLQVLSSAVILWLSLPLFTALIELIEGILVAA